MKGGKAMPSPPKVITKASEELLAAPLPELILGLGMAVAKANQEMAKGTGQGPSLVYSIPSAEIEINVAISIEKSDDLSVSGGLNLSAFSVNASYKSTYGFKEEASSRIKLVLQAKPTGSTELPGS
jgi:hypothetical protein